MSQAELEQCAAVAQAKVEWEHDQFFAKEAAGLQPAIYIGHDRMAEMARVSRQLILKKQQREAETCPEDCPTTFFAQEFGYTNSETENRIAPLVEEFRETKPDTRRNIVNKCYERLLK